MIKRPRLIALNESRGCRRWGAFRSGCLISFRYRKSRSLGHSRPLLDPFWSLMEQLKRISYPRLNVRIIKYQWLPSCKIKKVARSLTRHWSNSSFLFRYVIMKHFKKPYFGHCKGSYIWSYTFLMPEIRRMESYTPYIQSEQRAKRYVQKVLISIKHV